MPDQLTIVKSEPLAVLKSEPLPDEVPQSGPIYRAAAGVGRGIMAIPQMLGALTERSSNPIEAAMLSGMGAPPGLGNVGRGIAQAHADQFNQARDAYGRGDYVEAGLRGVASAVPLLGPTVASLADRAVGGDVAGAMGEAATMAIPLKVPKVGRLTKTARVADSLERAAERRIVDVMTPKGSSRAIKETGIQAEKFAPNVLNEPTMTGLSREALKDRVETRLGEAQQKLNAAEARRPRGPADLFDPDPIKAGLREKLQELQAPSARGPEAHAKVESMGVNTLPDRPPVSTTPFSEMPVQYKQELRRLRAELEEFQYQEGRRVSQEEIGVSREGGYGAGRGARHRGVADSIEKDYHGRQAGTPVYHDILMGKTGTTRNAMIKSLGRFIDGTQKSTPIVDRAIQVADRRLRDPDSTSRPMLPPEAGFDDIDVAGPVGQNVLPEPNRIEAAILQKVIQEIDDLGPAVSYDALKAIRQAWDKKAEYVKTSSMDPTADVKRAQRVGARKATGVMRDAMAIIDENTAAANAEYHIWRSVDDVMEAATDTERVRPRVGRKIMTQAIASMIGGGAAGLPGMAGGYLLGSILDGAMAAGVTTKIATARGMNRLSKALRKGNDAEAMAAIRNLAALTKQIPKLNALLAQQRQEAE